VGGLSRHKLDTVAEAFPEFYTASQHRLAERMMLHSQREFIAAQRRSGEIPNSVAGALLSELDRDLRQLRSYDTSQLQLDPVELLSRVPMFRDLSQQELQTALPFLRKRTLPARHDLIKRGPGTTPCIWLRGVKCGYWSTSTGGSTRLKCWAPAQSSVYPGMKPVRSPTAR